MSTYTIPMLIYEKAFKEFNSGEARGCRRYRITLIAVGFLYFKFCYKPQETEEAFMKQNDAAACRLKTAKTY